MPNTIAISCVKALKEKYKLNFINIKELISLSEYIIEDEDIIQCSSLVQKIEIAINEKKNHKNVVKKAKEEKIPGNQISPPSNITKVIPSIKMNID